MAQDDRLQRAIRGDDRVRRRRADEDGLPQRQIRGALQRRARRIRGAELLEALWVQHQRRRRRTWRSSLPRRRAGRVTAGAQPGPGIAEHARTQAVDDVGLALTDEIQRAPAGAQPEERIRRGPIQHRRPAPSSSGEGVVRHEDQADGRIDRLRRERLAARRRLCDQRDLDVAGDERPGEIVDVAFESAEPVQREDRAADKRHSDRGDQRHRRLRSTRSW
jgi:hypothetical protein